MMNTPTVARTIKCLVALALLLHSQACYDDNATRPPGTSDANAPQLASLLQEDLGEPPQYAGARQTDSRVRWIVL